MRSTKSRQRLKLLLWIFSCCVLLSLNSYAQRTGAGKISGKIISKKKSEPVAGATVAVKGTGVVTVSDSMGNYTIEAAPGNTLIITSVGFSRTEVRVGKSTTLNLQMDETVNTLDDVVVVSVGYGTLNKKEVSSAITHLTSKDLLQIAGNGALNAIQGKVAGLSITNTAPGDVNSTPSIQLRGVSSRNAGLEPLYVINGIPGGNIDNLSPNDIESIDVLKGGAASAIYGTRGGNGVIIITTKKGTSVSKAYYEGYFSTDVPTNKIKILSPEQFVAHNRGTDYGYKTDWFKEVQRDRAYQHKHVLNFSGGNSRFNYYASFDYRDAKGLDLRSTKKEYGARISLNHTSANDLYSVSVNIAPRKLMYNNSSYDAFNQALTLNPTQPIKDTVDPTKYLYINNGFPGSYNPVEDLKTILNGGEGRYLEWSGSFKLNILKNLNTQVTVGEQQSIFFNHYFKPSYNTQAIYGNSGRGTANKGIDKSDQRFFDWIGNYNLHLNKQNIKVLGGYTFNYFNSEGLSAENQNFPSDALTYNNLGNGVYNIPIPNGASGDYTFRKVGSFQNDSKLIAFFGRINYDYDGKYFLSASIRREGSSKFGKGNKWGNFPAISAGWRISKEQFLSNVSWINDLKLRADYGETGNQNFDNYLSLSTYQGWGYFNYNGLNYQVWGPSQNTNYNLRWEKAQNFNVGADFELFDNRIEGSMNYFVRKNTDLLGQYDVPVPPNLLPSTYVNVGSMKNSGFELQLNAKVIRSKDLAYNVSFVGATNNNKFVSFSNDVYKGQSYVDLVSMPSPGSPGTAQRLQEGKRVGSFFMLKSAGIDATGRLMVYDKSGKIIPGNQATADDKQFVGNGLPKFTASLGQSVNYKNFDLNVFFRGAFGYDIYNTVAFKIGTPATQTGANVMASAYGSGKYAALTSPETYASLSDYFLEKGDFVKLDNVSLGYTLKSPIKQFESARFYLTGRNLYTFTKWTTGDVESVSVNGLAPGVNNALSYYPSTVQFIGGLQIKF